MKKRTRNKLLAFIAILLIAVLVVMPVSASGDPYQRQATTNLESTLITKDFQIRADCNVPTATFNFKVEPGSAIQYSASTPTLYPVYAGVIPGLVITPLTGNAATAGTDATSVEAGLKYNAQLKSLAAANGDQVTYTSETDTGTGYYIVSKTVTLDFSGVTFTEPGVYRYKITESGSDTSISMDTTVRTLDVYVKDSELTTGNYLEIFGYTMYKGEVSVAPNSDGSNIDTTTYAKTSTFTNTYPTASLTFGKEVTGNQGSRDKYFDFTLVMTGPIGAKLNVDLTKANDRITIPENKENPNLATTCINSATDVTQVSSIELTDNGSGTGTATTHFYLQDGQYITINGLAKGMTYAVTENAEEYTSTPGITAANSTFNKDAVDGYDALSDATSGDVPLDAQDNPLSVYTGFTNNKTGAIPTGVVLSAVPWVIAGVVILAGIVFFAIRSKRKYEEE